ncbi:hypothetical protein ACFL2V_03170 [Pseudomonadota bacterium]
MGVLTGFERLSTGARIVVVSWLIAISSFYISAAYFAAAELGNNRLTSAERHEARMSLTTVENGKTEFDSSLLNGENGKHASKVEVGVYLDRVIGLSTKSTDWTADFYIWFRWTDKNIDPGNSFQVIGGEIIKTVPIITKDDKSNKNTEKYYTLYRVTARITKFFNIMRYPLDNHMLTLHIEEKKGTWREFQYIADTTNTKRSSRVKIPGYKVVGGPQIIVKPHAYKSNRGDPSRVDSGGNTYSQFIYGLAIQRPDWGLYFKMFQGLFASVAIAFLAFLFQPTSGERIRLGVGAFFASVASSYVNLGQLPGVSMVTMTDMMNGIAMGTIFLSLWASVISARLATNEQYMDASKKLDVIMLTIFVTGFVSANVVIALSASTL